MKPTNMKVGDRWWRTNDMFPLGTYFDVMYKTEDGFHIKWSKGRSYDATADPAAWGDNYYLDEAHEVIKILNEYKD
jgi:hypothetical protein